jgi:hypothetical protein
MRIGGLYKLNPLYDNHEGKQLYDIRMLENFLEEYKDTTFISDVFLMDDDIIMLIETDLFYSHVPALKETRFIKILLKNYIYLFPYNLYKSNIFVEV